MSIVPARKLRLGLYVSLCTLTLAPSLFAQRCPCLATRPFADCPTRILIEGGDPILALPDASFPDSFPSSAAIIQREGFSDILLIADFFSGRAYGWQYSLEPVETIVRTQFSIASPGGARATTGLTYANEFLLWAVEGQIWRTDIQGEDALLLGTVDMAAIADMVRADTGDANIATGVLGGITYHSTRTSLWAVDIVNDLYFEITTDGDPVLADGKLNYFFNPMRNGRTGGAYGNDITYVANAAGEFFDIPVGSLADGKPSRVLRVRATDEGGAIGEQTGVLYNLDNSMGAPQFITGIVYWPNSCAPDQDSEILLDLDLDGGAPRIIEVSADAPTFSSVANFSCTSPDPASAQLTWSTGMAYDAIQISRRQLPDGTAEEVFTATFADDPQAFTDSGLAEGTYEYTLTTTAGNASPAPLVCRVNVGRGNILNWVRTDAGTLPFASTIAAGNLLVGHIDGFDVTFYDLGLTASHSISSPVSGTVTGLTYHPGEERLYWLVDDGGAHRLVSTDIDGNLPSAPVLVDTPRNFPRGSQLGDLSYDAANDLFWTADLLNAAIFPISADGNVPEAFRNAQLAPDAEDTTLSGGIDVAESTAGTVTLDFPIGSGNGIEALVRKQYDLETMEGTELFRVDLPAAIDSANVGGVASTGGFTFLTALDQQSVYQLQVGSVDVDLFRRGDVNNDGDLNIADPSYLLGNLFQGGTAPPCDASADANSDDALTIADAIFLFNYLFAGGEAPGSPFPGCGVDLDTALTCAATICSGA